MNRILVGLCSIAALSLPAQALADCREIVADTVAEMRAGATQWNDDMERLARAAAGSACVKAGGNATPAGDGAQLIEEQSVRAGDRAEVAEADAGESAEAEASTQGGAEGSESWSPFKDIKFNKVSASPNKKPYERRREVNEPEE